MLSAWLCKCTLLIFLVLVNSCAGDSRDAGAKLHYQQDEVISCKKK
jgi:hypothetical protein